LKLSLPAPLFPIPSFKQYLLHRNALTSQLQPHILPEVSHHCAHPEVCITAIKKIVFSYIYAQKMTY
jgi:hypothetical protein